MHAGIGSDLLCLDGQAKCIFGIACKLRNSRESVKGRRLTGSVTIGARNCAGLQSTVACLVKVCVSQC